MVTVSRLLKDYADAGALNDRLAVWGFVDPVTFLTKAGAVGVMFRLEGVDDTCLDHAERQAVARRFEQALRQLRRVVPSVSVPGQAASRRAGRRLPSKPGRPARPSGIAPRTSRRRRLRSSTTRSTRSSCTRDGIGPRRIVPDSPLRTLQRRAPWELLSVRRVDDDPQRRARSRRGAPPHEGAGVSGAPHRHGDAAPAAQARHLPRPAGPAQPRSTQGGGWRPEVRHAPRLLRGGFDGRVRPRRAPRRRLSASRS